MTEKPTGSMALLRSLRDVAGRSANVSVAAAAIGGIVTVASAQVLASTVDHTVFGQATLVAIGPCLAVLFGLAVMRAVAGWITERSAFEAAAAVRRHLFRSALVQISQLGPVRLSDRPSGELAAALTDAVDAVAPLWRSWKPAIVRAAAVPLAVLLVVTPRDPLAALIMIVALPLLVWFSMLAGKGAEQASGAQWASLTRLGGHLLDQIRGLGELKLAGTSPAAIASVKAAAEAYGRNTMAVLRIAFLSALVVEFVATGAIAGVAIAVGFRLLWGEMDFATGFFVLLLAPEFFAPLRDIGARRHARIEALTALDTLARLLDAPPPAAVDTVRTPTAPPTIRFENVGVVHDDGRVALDDFNLDIAAGEHVALTGASGAGKSTVAALLARVIEPTTGRILVDGRPLTEIDPVAWRRAVVQMPQTPHFFEGTIADNVIMGRAAPGDERDAALREALVAAGASEFVDHLPQSADSLLAERGQNLSGGEAQRLALARALFSAGPLVLVDEPTAHLDTETQAVVMKGLAELRQGRTMLSIAHRRETIVAADRIVRMDRGRIVEAGSAASVLADEPGQQVERSDA